MGYVISAMGLPRYRAHAAALLAGALTLLAGAGPLAAQRCERVITADVVALDQTIWYNRFGAYSPAGMIFALRRDVVPTAGNSLEPGKVKLRSDKRPRPLVLRANVGDCLRIRFENLLAPIKKDDDQPTTRAAGIHVIGMQPVDDIYDDGSFVGTNPSSIGEPGEDQTYTLYAQAEGTFLLYSTAATTGGEGVGGSLAHGLFGAVNVQPRGAEWYRSQVSQEDLALATTAYTTGARAGFPIIDYDKRYPSGHRHAGLPILQILHGNEIVHSELSAIITGPGRRSWPTGTFAEVTVTPNRTRPFREFTVIFHDEVGAIQAFPEFEDPEFKFTLHGGRDAFAVNYGADGIGAPVLANRLGVGPSWNCSECKYEEFFLSSWARGDPALLVDLPANAGNAAGLIRGPKATRALYPDDPSNVHHSYLNDRIIINNLHAGPKEHHVFHLHAHQWLKSPDSDNSTILDSQAIGPGAGFRYELTHDGAGNRNRTPGDAIFHCHFYPHFAQGMWGLMRVHDVLEMGTVLDAGRPAAGARALPDGEIESGIPIPAVVPIPGEPLAPLPSYLGNPGFPFYVPGVAGRRPPQPPLDMVHDGGLPRHVVLGGTTAFPELNTLSFRKENVTLDALELAQDGTAAEKAAMAFHALPHHPSVRVDPVSGAVSAATFRTNGAVAAWGAPFADPCRTDGVPAASFMRTYKGAAFQMDAKYNKAGWHFPQHRMYALWDDINAYLSGQRAPEPLFMRTHSGDCIEFHLVNLVPHEYLMDDFQVLTPTDVMGQHIHLVKFDVTSSDGGANGFNYEDGSLSPGEVRERIHAINEMGGLKLPGQTARRHLAAVAHPTLGPGRNGEWLGAQQTVQRWYTDDVLNASGEDRGLGTIFTHDHFAPSTIQQTGAYAAVVQEPRGSRWFHNERDEELGTRQDGGPTSWSARIVTADPRQSYREFNLITTDFVPAYERNSAGFPDPQRAINPPGRHRIGLPFLTARPVDQGCPNGSAAPCPELLSADHPGTMLVNYRNEPLALRVRDPSTNRQAEGEAGDLALAFQSRTNWADRDLRRQPNFYPPLTAGVQAGDPFTPLLRAYEGDRLQLRVNVGSQEHGHNFTLQGSKWLREPDWADAGYTSSQMITISEKFTLQIPVIPDRIAGDRADYLYTFGAATDDLWNGAWGIMRSHRRLQNTLGTLPNNVPTGTGNRATFGFASNASDFVGVCPKHSAHSSRLRRFEVVGVLARDVLAEGTLVYNARGEVGGPLHDPTAILYVRLEDLDPVTGKLKPDVPVEPLILRASAGECIRIKLHNRLPIDMPDLDGYSTLPSIVDRFNANQIRPSNRVGFHAQMVSMDVTRSAGASIGSNPNQVVQPGDTTVYVWYAGHVEYDASTRRLNAVPAELGAANLLPADPIKHAMKGAVGALIIEPEGATWIEDAHSRAAATVTLADNRSFREFVLIFQSDLNLYYGDGTAVPIVSQVGEDSEDAGHPAFNYRTEPMWKRLGYAPDATPGFTRDVDFARSLSNEQVGGDPVTPVFEALVGQQVRFRVLHPAGGRQREHTFQLHGHGWQVSPYSDRGLRLGPNPRSSWNGIVDGIGPSGHFDLLITHGAGGAFGVPGDYLYRDQTSTHFERGLWGILRVREP
jgi:manganese oxidase